MRFRVYTLCFALTIFGAIGSPAKASEIGANIKAQTQFLKSIPPRATLAQIKKLLPASTKYTGPEQVFSDVLYGNRIDFRGKINGTLLFLSAAQARQMSNYKLSEEARKKIFRYRPSDKINAVWVIMDKASIKSSANEKKRIQAASRYLGKPAEVGPAGSIDYYVGATWRLPGNRTINYGISHLGFARDGEPSLARSF